MKQVSRGLDLKYTSIGFEAECAVAIIQSIRRRDNKNFFIENRRFVLNYDTRSIREILSGDVGRYDDFVISGDNAKQYNESFGENDGTFKCLECLSWTNRTSNISVDFNTFRDKLLGFYRFLLENGTVDNGVGMFEFIISDRESIVIRYLPAKFEDLSFTRFQSTISCEMDYVLYNFDSIYENITGVHLRQFIISSKLSESSKLKYHGLFNYLVHTFLDIYENKKGELLDRSVDRKAFVPLALRNKLDHIIEDKDTRETFAKSLKKIIIEIADLKSDDEDDEDEELGHWIAILKTYIYNMPQSLDITPVNMSDEITLEIRCFERRFLSVVPNRRSRRVILDDDEDDEDDKGVGLVKKTRKRRQRRTYKKRNHKHTNKNKNKNKK
jgi:hypothetical protein